MLSTFRPPNNELPFSHMARALACTIVGQWSNSPSANQQWTITVVGGFYKVINRTNGKCLDTGGSTADGAAMQFWTSGSSSNQQRTFELISSQ